MVFNQGNVWANMQAHAEPWMIHWDVYSKAHWKPLLDGGVAYAKPSVQPAEIDWAPADDLQVQALQTSIERVLQERMEEWRTDLRVPFRLHPYTCRVAKNLLPCFEAHMQRDGEVMTDAAHEAELSRIRASFPRLSGFPINVAFKEIEPVVEAVRNTATHLRQADGLQFGMAVHVHGYPNGVMSVWVYVAALEPPHY